MSRAPRPGRTLAALALAALVACEGSPAGFEPGPDAGGLDLSRVVAVGDGFAAGATDDALYATAQERSLPALFAARVAGEEDFAQPLVPDPGFGIGNPDGGRLSLLRVFPPELTRLPRGAEAGGGPDRPYDNLGVPRALASEALVAESQATSTLGNPFYDLVLRGRGTFARQVADRAATLVLVWLGTSDVSTYAAAGGDAALAPGLPTPVGTFESLYGQLVDALLETTDRVVLFDVLDPTSLPLTRAVPPVVIDPETGEPVTRTRLVTVIDPVTGDTIQTAVEEPVPLLGPDGELGPGDLVTLDARPLLAAGVGIPTGLPEVQGTGTPLPDRVVLNAGEIGLIREAVTGYDQAIHRIAAERDLPVVPVHDLVETLAGPGVVSDGVRLTADWITGQAFGLDGTYFTPKGYGVVTNLLIDALNRTWGSDLPHVRTADLPGVRVLP